MNAIRIRKRLGAPIPELPELTPMMGKNVEIIVMEVSVSEDALATVATPGPINILDDLGSKLPGDPFGPDFEQELRKWREEPWRSDAAPAAVAATGCRPSRFGFAKGMFELADDFNEPLDEFAEYK